MYVRVYACMYVNMYLQFMHVYVRVCKFVSTFSLYYTELIFFNVYVLRSNIIDVK